MSKTTYLDACASYPLLPVVQKALQEIVSKEEARTILGSNPSSVHACGREANQVLSELKQKLLKALDLKAHQSSQLTLCSSATEAINFAVHSFSQTTKKDKKYWHSTVEHPAVWGAVSNFDKADVVELAVDKNGELAPLPEFKKDAHTLLILQSVNNETGIAFDLLNILAPLQILRKTKNLSVLIDGSQSFLKTAPDTFKKLLPLVDAMVFSSQKVGALDGVGVLWARESFELKAMIKGGGQELGRRGGSLSLLSAYSFSVAIDDWLVNGKSYREHSLQLKNFLKESLEKNFKQISFHEGANKEYPFALTNVLNFHIPAMMAIPWVALLDQKGFCVSAGSACQSGSALGSKVLRAMGFGNSESMSSLRVSFSIQNTKLDIESFVKALLEIHRSFM